MIVLKESKIQFKNPVLGQPTRAVDEHYYARRIVAIVDGEERHFRFMASELPFTTTEDDMIDAIKAQLTTQSSKKV